jgi:hypothetical protein
MFNSGILDVAIGLVFIFLLLSLICSAFNEMIETRLKWRATHLEQGIRELLNDPKGSGLANKIYNHPLVYGLFKGAYDPQKIKWRCLKSSNLPSYIPSRNFALVLMDIILPANQTRVSGAVGATVPTPAAPASPSGGGTPPYSVQLLRNNITSIQNPKVEQALMTLVDAAGNDISKARENIEGWYDNAMERVGGWYKRRSQWIVLVVGLAVAITINADTITIAKSLSYDTAMRNSLVAAAQEYAKAPQTVGKEGKAPEVKVKDNLKEIQKLGLPIGWNVDDERTVPAKELGAWLLKLLGWLLTAMAISLGAPFWFDLLNKFMNARSTLKPSKPEAPQKD